MNTPARRLQETPGHPNFNVKVFNAQLRRESIGVGEWPPQCTSSSFSRRLVRRPFSSLSCFISLPRWISPALRRL
ncbi:hypothetical protein GQ55_1G394300 [Panicum hallii var. hallii]|uniref:Uncharacterized protein n=1 Tax=Panicum hallii var. hallii TaxID=1504633 RepID=A0A2T7FC93_9POAL|nr:hypothetical protein GQ55_1G394300 [Panicum hallii var. hallii]